MVLKVTTPVPFPVSVIVVVVLPVLPVGSMVFAMFSALVEFCVIVLVAPLNCSELPPRKKLLVLALKVMLLSTNGGAFTVISLLRGLANVPVFVVPPKTRSVVVALVGAVPPQFAALLHNWLTLASPVQV